jgi:hypothetical protein
MGSQNKLITATINPDPCYHGYELGLTGISRKPLICGVKRTAHETKDHLPRVTGGGGWLQLHPQLRSYTCCVFYDLYILLFLAHHNCPLFQFFCFPLLFIKTTAFLVSSFCISHLLSSEYWPSMFFIHFILSLWLYHQNIFMFHPQWSILSLSLT